jgi:ketosteroid isomerase-like protein
MRLQATWEVCRVTETADGLTETNREAIRRAFEAWQQGTGAITEVFAPDMVWRIEGHSVASKEYKDRQQIIDEVLAPFGARFSAERFRPVNIRSVHADGATVIVLWDGRGIANDGQPYESTAPPFTTASPSTTCGLGSNPKADAAPRPGAMNRASVG